jgi:type II secretory pathway pseudopilin PulG
MTPDLYFALIPVMGTKIHTEKKKLIQLVLTESEKPGVKEAVAKSTTEKAGPLMQAIKKYADEDEITRNSTQLDANKKDGNNNNNNKKHQKNTQYNNGNNQKQTNAASVAYSAQTEDTSQQQTLHIAYSVKRSEVKPNSTFSTAITRKDECYIIKGGNKIPYTATLGQCQQCHGKLHNPHTPKCSTATCTKCALTGHDTAECLQTAQGYRQAILASRPPKKK